METDGRKLVGMSLVFLVVLFVAGNAYASSLGVINASNVNVRMEPNRSSEIIGCLANNYIVEVIETSGDWHKVKFSESEEGWMSAQYITVVDGIGSGVVEATALNLRQQPNTTCQIIGSLGSGREVTILETVDGWYRVKTSSGTIGWVSKDYVTASFFDDSPMYGVEPLGEAIVNGDTVNVRQGAGKDNRVLFCVNQGNKVSILSKSGEWYEIETLDGRKGWICEDFISIRGTLSSRGSVLAVARASSSVRDRVVETAKKFLGTPYKWGANGPDKFDCSGFTKYVMAMFEVKLNRCSQDQVKQGKYVAKSELRPGDLVFFDKSIGHVGIYIGDGNFIHASGTQTRPNKVIISSLSTSYYAGRYATARNVLD